MRIHSNIYNAIALAALLVMLSHTHPARAQGCPGNDGRFNILTINVLFFEPGKPLANRLEALAEQLDTLIDNAAIAVPDAILAQELTRGLLAEPGAKNSPELLADLLEQKLGESYTHRAVFETGIPFLFSTANAIYVREPCQILAKLVTFLPRGETVSVGSLEIPITRNVMMVLVNAGGKLISLYNTHLCAGGCTDEQREAQNDAALVFIENVENFLNSLNLDPRSIVYGGDLNSDIFRGRPEPGIQPFGPEKPMIYDKIIAAGFIDGYFDGQLEDLSELCLDESDPDLHCTTGVTPLDAGKARRIDYVFLKGFRSTPDVVSTVIFNSLVDASEPNVDISDHAGVYVGAPLP